MSFLSKAGKIRVGRIPVLGGCMRRNCAPASQQGFSLITAIFLLVVIVSLGTLMVTFWGAQQQGSALDALGVRADHASKAGIEWGAFQITQGTSFATSCHAPVATSSVPSVSSVSMANTPLSSYTLVVSCFATSHVEVASTVWAYSLTATASGIDGAVPGSTDYVERKTQSVIWR